MTLEIHDEQQSTSSNKLFGAVFHQNTKTWFYGVGVSTSDSDYFRSIPATPVRFRVRPFCDIFFCDRGHISMVCDMVAFCLVGLVFFFLFFFFFGAVRSASRPFSSLVYGRSRKGHILKMSSGSMLNIVLLSMNCCIKSSFSRFFASKSNSGAIQPSKSEPRIF